MATTHTPRSSTLGQLPEWYPKLKASSLADGQAKFRQYLQNAEESIAKADTDPRDEDLFWETKYSSAAGQFGYLAAMMLVDGFLATYLKYKPMESLIPESQAKKWTLFHAKGLGGKMGYNRLLTDVFGDEIDELFELVHTALHVTVHYGHHPAKRSYSAGMNQLLAFEKAFTEKAKQVLEAHGIEDWA